MNRVDLYEVVTQIARLVESMLGCNPGLKIKVNGMGATIHIPPINASDPADVNTHTVFKPQSVADGMRTATSGLPKPLLTKTLAPDELEAECSRVLALAGNISGGETKTIDLFPWLAGKQVGEVISRTRAAGFYVKVWRYPLKAGQPVKHKHTKDGSSRIFVTKLEEVVVSPADAGTQVPLEPQADNPTPQEVPERSPQPSTAIEPEHQQEAEAPLEPSPQPAQPTILAASPSGSNGDGRGEGHLLHLPSTPGHSFFKDDPDPLDLSCRSSSRKKRERAERAAQAAESGRRVMDLFRLIHVQPQPDDWRLARPTRVPRRFTPGHYATRPQSLPQSRG